MTKAKTDTLPEVRRRMLRAAALLVRARREMVTARQHLMRRADYKRLARLGRRARSENYTLAYWAAGTLGGILHDPVSIGDAIAWLREDARPGGLEASLARARRADAEDAALARRRVRRSK
jgi:hypothetical protein